MACIASETYADTAQRPEFKEDKAKSGIAFVCIYVLCIQCKFQYPCRLGTRGELNVTTWYVPSDGQFWAIAQPRIFYESVRVRAGIGNQTIDMKLYNINTYTGRVTCSRLTLNLKNSGSIDGQTASIVIWCWLQRQQATRAFVFTVNGSLLNQPKYGISLWTPSAMLEINAKKMTKSLFRQTKNVNLGSNLNLHLWSRHLAEITNVDLAITNVDLGSRSADQNVNYNR
jgi:hypothetical protein